MSKISIISPVYNASEYICRFVDSVVAQSYEDWELICVDDGSEDNSVQILNEYAERDGRIHVVQQEHCNAGAARNRGMEKATGKYIMFLDCDDECMPNMLQTAYSAAEEKQADAVIFQTNYIDSSSSEPKPMPWSIRWNLIKQLEDDCLNAEMYPDTLFQLFIISPWNKLFLREMLTANAIQAQSQLAANDVVLITSCLACAKKIYPIHDTLYTQHRDNGNSITQNLNADEKCWCGYTASLGMKEALERVGRYQLLRYSYQQLAWHNCIWYLLKNEGKTKFDEMYTHLHHEGIQKLDLADNVYFAKGTNLPKEELNMIRQVSETTLPEYLHSKIDKLAREKYLANQNFAMLSNSITYKTGKAVLFVPRLIVNAARKVIGKVKGLYGKYIVQKIKRKQEKRQYTINLDLREKELVSHRENAKLRICILAYERFHYNVVENMIQICNPQKNYIEVCTDRVAKAEIAPPLGENEKQVVFSLMEYADVYKKWRTDNWNGHRMSHLDKRIRDKKWDMIIIPSAEYHPEWYAPVWNAATPDTKIILGVHNLNTVFHPEHRAPEVYDFYNKANGYAVIDDCLKTRIRQWGIDDKEIYVFPSVHSPKSVVEPNTKDDDARINLIVTGLVEESRKDYLSLVEAFEKLADIHSQLRLVLLGKAKSSYAQMIVQKFTSMKKTGLEFVSYPGYVPVNEFDEELEKADCLLGPAIVTTYNNDVEEQYGISKVSGMQQDIIKYGKPAIVTHAINMPVEMNSSVLYYTSTDELAEMIRKFLDRDYCEQIARNAIENSMHYTLDNLKW